MENPFKWRHHEAEIILTCVRWYLRYALSYRDLAEMMTERGLWVVHTTLFRWVQDYAPEIDKRSHPHLKKSCDSWRVEETYVKVRGKWMYLYRAVDSTGQTLDFQLNETRSTRADKRFFKKMLGRSHISVPRVINVDQNAAYPGAIHDLKQAGLLPDGSELRPVRIQDRNLRYDMYAHQEESMRRFFVTGIAALLATGLEGCGLELPASEQTPTAALPPSTSESTAPPPTEESSDVAEACPPYLIGLPIWSPDGTQIAYEATHHNTTYLGIADLKTSSIAEVTTIENFGYVIEWSPDGTRLLYERRDETGYWLSVINLDGTGGQDVLDLQNVYGVDWSPDGEQIAFVVDEHELRTMPLATLERTLVYRDSDAIYGVQWSPSGEHFAALAHQGESWSVKIVNADGTGLNAVINDVDPNTKVAWSPDGAWVAFVNQKGALQIARPDGTEIVTLFEAFQYLKEFSWLPNASGLLVITAVGNRAINRLALDGTMEELSTLPEMPVADDACPCLYLAFSPDGTHVALVHKPVGPEGARRLIVATVEGDRSVEFNPCADAGGPTIDDAQLSSHVGGTIGGSSGSRTLLTLCL